MNPFLFGLLCSRFCRVFTDHNFCNLSRLN